MKKLVLVMFLLTMVNMFELVQSVELGEPVKFGNSIYMVTGGENRGLTATEIFKVNP